MTTRVHAKRHSLVSPSSPLDAPFPPPPPLFLPPPDVLDTSEILASVIPLPKNYSIGYAHFKPSSSCPDNQVINCIEQARKHLIQRYASGGILDSLLPYVRVTRDESSLWVFAIAPEEMRDTSSSSLSTLQFDQLECTVSSFKFSDLYPCSDPCSTNHEPCQTCLELSNSAMQSESTQPSPNAFTPASAGQSSSLPSSATYLPRISLRIPYIYLLRAVREHIIDGLCAPTGGRGRGAVRLSNGFILDVVGSEGAWSLDWKSQLRNRTLMHCNLDLSLHTEHILVQIRPKQTSLSPLIVTPTIPLGTPLSLAPYCTPAYYMGAYSGSSEGLIHLFESSLSGLGCGNWQDAMQTLPSEQKPGRKARQTTFILVWVNVQNKQGDEKGIITAWPAKLAFGLSSQLVTKADGTTGVSYAYGRKVLAHIPQVPSHGQYHHDGSLFSASISTPLSFTSPASAFTPASSLQQSSFHLPADRNKGDHTRRPSHKRSRTAPNVESLTVYKSMHLSRIGSSNIRKVIGNVGSYVDSVVKDRERERERLRKEREAPKVNRSPAESSATPADNGSASSGSQMSPPGPSLSEAKTPAPQTPAPPSQVEEQQSAPVPLPLEQQPIIASSVDPLSQAMAHAEPMHDVQTETAVQQPQAANFDAFGGMDGSWSGDFMKDLGMDFPMSNPSQENADPRRENIDVDMETFGVFTDDDFNFFDVPATGPVPGSLPSVGAHELESGLTPAAGPAPLGMSPPLYTHVMNQLGGGQLATSPGQSHPSPWVPSVLADTFGTPRFPGATTFEAEANAAQNVPSSPTRTASTPEEALTPGVHITFTPSIVTEDELSQRYDHAPFDSIPFASRHRLNDEKYLLGKFAFSNPPTPEADTLPSASWKNPYLRVTDPRIGVFERLVGVKRKKNGHGQEHRQRQSWDASDEWLRDDSDGLVEDVETLSDADSEVEEILPDDPKGPPRPATPPPPPISLGPTLLACQFTHSHLLPLSTNLRPPDAVISVTDEATVAPISAPTPVSPAAVLGTAAERTKSLETAVQYLCKEVVENPVWSDIWQGSIGACPGCEWDENFWQSNARKVATFLEGMGHGESNLRLDTLIRKLVSEQIPPAIGSSLISFLKQPKITVGKADAIIHVLPPALRFWNKLGLSPRGGSKDVRAYLLYQESDEVAETQAIEWLAYMSNLYSGRGYGSHYPGGSSLNEEGLVPLRFDVFRKKLASFLAEIPESSNSTVLYVVTPPNILTLSSTVFRQVLSAINRTIAKPTSQQIHFQFVPHSTVFGALDTASARERLLTVVNAVYDRLLHPATRLHSREASGCVHESPKTFQTPSFALARTHPTHISLSFQHPAPILGVADGPRTLHVGYTVSACRKWILAACVDERGDAHEVGAWLAPEGGDVGRTVRTVWAFASEFAGRADVRWVVAVVKAGTMGAGELEAWMSVLGDAGLTQSLPVWRACILALDPEGAWRFVPPAQHTSSTPSPFDPDHKRPGVWMQDQSLSTYALNVLLRLPLPVESDRDLNLSACFIPDDDDVVQQEEIPLRPLMTSTLICSPAGADHTRISALHIHFLYSKKSSLWPSSSATDEEVLKSLTSDFHALASLARTRWRLNAELNLPFHLAALQVMQSALQQGDAILD